MLKLYSLPCCVQAVCYQATLRPSCAMLCNAVSEACNYHARVILQTSSACQACLTAWAQHCLVKAQLCKDWAQDCMHALRGIVMKLEYESGLSCRMQTCTHISRHMRRRGGTEREGETRDLNISGRTPCSTVYCL